MNISCDASCSGREPSVSAEHFDAAQPSALVKQRSASHALALALPRPPAPTRPEEPTRARRRGRSACWCAHARRVWVCRVRSGACS